MENHCTISSYPTLVSETIPVRVAIKRMGDMPTAVKDFLVGTKYCDSDNEVIRTTTSLLTDGITDEREKAVKIFDYVRDTVLYCFGPWNTRASETLMRRRGMCTNKNNLFIAMLRAAGIPSGYGILDVDAREYFGVINLPTFQKYVSPRSVHFYSYVYLDGQWHKCDPSTDLPFALRVGDFNPPSVLVRWDGTCDSLPSIDPRHISGDHGPYSTVDDRLDKKTRNMNDARFRIANSYVSWLRNNKVNYVNRDKLEEDFRKWLRHSSIRDLLILENLRLFARFRKQPI